MITIRIAHENYITPSQIEDVLGTIYKHIIVQHFPSSSTNSRLYSHHPHLISSSSQPHRVFKTQSISSPNQAPTANMLLHNLIAIGLAATATAQIPGLPIPGVPGASGVPSVPEVPGIPGAPGVPGIDKLTPEKLIENIKNITQQSEALQKPVNDISSGNLNGSLPFIGDSPLAKVFTGFTDIVSLATSTVSGAKDLDKVPAGPVADAIFEGFRQVCLCSFSKQDTSLTMLCP